MSTEALSEPKPEPAASRHCLALSVLAELTAASDRRALLVHADLSGTLHRAVQGGSEDHGGQKGLSTGRPVAEETGRDGGSEPSWKPSLSHQVSRPQRCLLQSCKSSVAASAQTDGHRTSCRPVRGAQPDPTTPGLTNVHPQALHKWPWCPRKCGLRFSLRSHGQANRGVSGAVGGDGTVAGTSGGSTEARCPS